MNGAFSLNLHKLTIPRRSLPAKQTSDQCDALRCWAESLDSRESVEETHRPAGRQGKFHLQEK